ncbi:Ethanolaminephosphotransferase 1 [Amphibalanus amphitrite]|uniref:Ethanolaminephosphotransferase 1 n=1 Tax=Amphibalanus amphitrite TaxID=1232801 RepID=A0A6A4W866_AMPAM|nr:ethanolaminephosphotransferase 1-like [Amphibalanus amphitrite]KAF0302685.1 Ethanolaminephosphotransferase 1 [Amphibalanus amphitrite]
MLFNTKYLRSDHITGFENYKYNSVDTSPLSNYVMHPFWNAVVKICPRRIAPNLLTLTGFLLTVVNFGLLTFYDYYFVASSVSNKPEVRPVPRWVWLMAAVNLFLSHTLDGIDGKQARRLGMSGPLGELFDHGLDSWSSFFIPITLFSVFGKLEYSIPPIRMFFCMWSVFMCFFLSHWEKYNTGLLFLPWGYDLSQVSMLLLYLATFFGDYTVWKWSLYNAADGTPIITAGATFEILMWVGSLGSALPVTLWNIYKSYRDGTGKGRSLGAALLPLLSPCILLGTATAWALLSPSDVINVDLRLFTYVSGVVFSNICCRLIVAQMTNTDVQPLNRLLAPVAVAAAVALLSPQSSGAEMGALWTLAVLVTLAHLHYGICVVRQMCHHFKIPALTVKQRVD